MNSRPDRGTTAIAPGAHAPGAMAFPEGAASPGGAGAATAAGAPPRDGIARGAAAQHGSAMPSAARRRYGAFLVLATLFLIFSGAEVKSRQAGLSVPDWPLSYGMWWPPMVGNVFFEHGHRVIAATLGLLIVIMAAWTARTEPRRWVRTLAWSALGAVIAQGLLGGLTVIHLLPPALSMSHGILAQTLLCALTWLAYATSVEWFARRDGALQADADRRRRALRTAGWAAGAVYVQLILGALMRHNEAGLAVPFFPTSPTGALLPDLIDLPVVLHMLHRGFAVIVLLLVLLAAWRVAQAWRHLARHASLLAGLVCAQVLLGATIIWTAQRDPDSETAWIKMPVPASLHVLLGAGLLATAWLLCLRCWRASPTSRAALSSAASPAVPAGADR